MLKEEEEEEEDEAKTLFTNNIAIETRRASSVFSLGEATEFSRAA